MRYVVEKPSLAVNIRLIKKEMGEVPVIGVVKGNGYGLGLVPFTKVLIEYGINVFAVARIDEAVALRISGIELPVLLLTPATTATDADTAVMYRITATIDSLASAELLDNAAKEHAVKANAHIKIDTGLGRYGFLPGAESEITGIYRNFNNIEFTGCYSHFYASFSPNPASVSKQMKIFNTVIKSLESAGINCGLKHIANSSAALKYPETRMDAVRIGSAFLGRLAIPNACGLKRIGHMECEISEIKELPINHNIGYGDVYRTKKPLRIAIIPIGHIDGFGMEKRRDSFRLRDTLRQIWHDAKPIFGDNNMYCLINGKNLPLVSRIGLTNIFVDVTGTDCKAGDIASFEVNPLTVDSAVERVYI